MAALGSELARADGPLKAEIGNATDRVAALLQGDKGIQEGYKKLALIVGAVTIARFTEDPAKAREILDAAKEGLRQID